MIQLNQQKHAAPKRYSSKFPFDKMEIGDSFDFADRAKDTPHRMRSLFYYYEKTRGIKCVIRAIEQNKYRVWRTA